MFIEKCRVPPRNSAQFTGLGSDKVRVKNGDRRFTWEKAAPRKVGKIVNLLRDEFQVFICGFLMNPYQNRIRRPLLFIRAVLIASDLKKTGVLVQNEIISPVAEQH